jgi:hypothetical protein
MSATVRGRRELMLNQTHAKELEEEPFFAVQSRQVLISLDTDATTFA